MAVSDYSIMAEHIEAFLAEKHNRAPSPVLLCYHVESQAIQRHQQKDIWGVLLQRVRRH